MFMSKKPNDKSLLNLRQRVGLVSIIFFGATAILLLSYYCENVFKSTLISVFFVLESISILFWFYDPLIYVVSRIFKRKIKPPLPPTPDRLNRFAVIGCAHNEERVIEELINSLFDMNYPREMFDVFVICDNCTDDTASVVRKAGAHAMERNDPDERGKGFGLEWMFGILKKRQEAGDIYDAYVILDADNLVNDNFLTAINEKMNQGYEILQAYLACKNPSDTWISKSYSYSYWISNANYQHAHSRLGLTAQMGGTGMILRPCVLEDVPWETDSLTEDLVLTARYVLEKNKPCAWVHGARLYDEKPLRTKPSSKQRTRWMQGHMDAMFRYGPKLLWSGIKNLSLKQFDMAFYLMRPMLNLLMFVCYVLKWLGVIVGALSFLVGSLMNARTAILLLTSYLLLHMYILFLENYGRYIRWIPIQMLFSLTWYVADI